MTSAELFAPTKRNKSQQDIADYDPLDHTVKGGSANPGSAYGVAITKAQGGLYVAGSGKPPNNGAEQEFVGGSREGPHSAGTTVPGFIGKREVPGGEG